VVRSCIVTLLPSLAQLCPDAFARTHLDEAVELLKKSAKSVELQAQVFLAMGKMCLAVGQHLMSRLEDLMLIIREVYRESSYYCFRFLCQQLIVQYFELIVGVRS